MSEQQFDENPAPSGTGGAGDIGSTGTAPHTGVARVDAVLETLDRLDELPLEEHVGVFESAHTELRRALDPDTQAHDAMARVAGATRPGQSSEQSAEDQSTDQS